MTPRTSLSSLPLLAICPGSASLPRTASTSAESRYGDAGHEMLSRRVGGYNEGSTFDLARLTYVHDLEPPHARDLATIARLLRLPVPPGALAEVALGLFEDGSVGRIEGGKGRYEDAPGLLLPGTIDAMWAEPEPLRVVGVGGVFENAAHLAPHHSGIGVELVPGYEPPSLTRGKPEHERSEIVHAGQYTTLPGSVLWVCDFKTGSDDNVAPVERNRQIRAAALLAARWTGATRVILALCYLDASEALQAQREGREYQGRWDVEMQDGAPRVLGAEELAEIEREVRGILSAAGIGGSDVREEDMSGVRTGECGAHEERDHAQGPRARPEASSGPGTGEKRPPSPHAGADAHGSGDGGGFLRQALRGGEDVSDLRGHGRMLDGSRGTGAGGGGELAHEGRDGEDRARHLVLATPRFVTGSHCDHCGSAGACPAWGGLVRAALSMRAEGQRDDPGAMPGAREPGEPARAALHVQPAVAGDSPDDDSRVSSVRGQSQLTPAERPHLLAMMRAARRAADAMQFVLRAGGPVRLPGGKVYAPALEEVRELDAGIALGVLMAEAGDGVATKAAGVTWASVERALEGQSKEARARVYEAIEEAGGVKVTYAERWRERQEEASDGSDERVEDAAPRPERAGVLTDDRSEQGASEVPAMGSAGVTRVTSTGELGGGEEHAATRGDHGCLVQGGDRRAEGQEAERGAGPAAVELQDDRRGGAESGQGDHGGVPVRSHARGVCAHCGVEIAVNKGGVARTHVDKRPAAHGSRCEGSALAARPLPEQQSIEGA